MSYVNRLGEIYVDLNSPDWVKTIRYTPEQVPPKERTPTSWQYSFVKAREVKRIPDEEKQRWVQIAPLRDRFIALEKKLTEEVRLYNENLEEFSKLSGTPMHSLSAIGIIHGSLSALPSMKDVKGLFSLKGVIGLAGKIVPIVPIIESIMKLVSVFSGIFGNKKKKMQHFARQVEYRANNIRAYQIQFMMVADQLRRLLESVPNYKSMMQEAVASARNAQTVAVTQKEKIEQRSSTARLQEIARIRQMNRNRVDLFTDSL